VDGFGLVHSTCCLLLSLTLRTVFVYRNY